MTELQHTSYYPFGGIIADTLLTRGRGVQNRTYNGKEQDFANSLFWLDYGARHYDPTRGQFTTYDPHCESYYNTNPLTYCHNTPINKIDIDGMDDYYSIFGKFLSHEDTETDNIIIRDEIMYAIKQNCGLYWITTDTPINKLTLTAEAYSNIFTDILSKMDGVNVKDLHNGKVSVTVWDNTSNIYTSDNYYNDSEFYGERNADIGPFQNKQRLNVYIYPIGTEERELYNTISNVQNLLGAHEYLGHYKGNLHGDGMNHLKVYKYQMKHPSWKKTTNLYKEYLNDVYHSYYK